MVKDKYDLYIESVQDPEGVVRFLDHIYRNKMFHDPYIPFMLREDFAGTGINCHEWLKSNSVPEPSHNKAMAVDIDSEPIQKGVDMFGDTYHGNRMYFHCEDSFVYDEPADMIICLNSSIFSVHSREELLRYFNDSYRRLDRDDGVFIFEIYGGPFAYMPGKDEVGFDDFTFVWQQEEVDLLSGHSKNSISFKIPDGDDMERAFTYDHRIWSFPELMDILGETDFRDTEVYLNTDFESSKEPDSYEPVDKVDVNTSFEAYIVCYK